jgi:hypothetical protein
MLKGIHCAVLLGVVLVACTAGVASTSSSAVPQQQAEVTSPSGLHVSASIVAATLGEECATGGGLVASDCAAPPQGSQKAAPGGCGGSYCQQSNVQISFNAGAGNQGARIEIVRVDLVDTAGSIVDTLTPSKPQSWSGNGYSAWDQLLKPAGDTKTSYDLTAPKWSTMNGARTTNAYSTQYKLHVTLRIDGVEVMLESTTLNREPAVAT